MRAIVFWVVVLGVAIGATRSSFASSFTFSTGDPDGRLASASVQSNPFTGEIEKETADDFLLTSPTEINSMSFTGLMPSYLPGINISAIGVKIYRTFPLDSTSPPSGSVPTRTDTPSDLVFDTMPLGTWTLTILNDNFAVGNTVINGVHGGPNSMTGGEGAATGIEMRFDFVFDTPMLLPAGHYFFVPQEQLTLRDFLWLSTPAPSSADDFEACTRNANLAPDWLRVGTDIIGGEPAQTYNMAFSLSGNTADVPEPSTAALVVTGLAAICFARRLW